MKRGASVAMALGLAGCFATTHSSERQLSKRDAALVALQRGEGARHIATLESLLAEHPDDLQLARMVAEAHVQAGSGAALLDRLKAFDTSTAHYMQGLVRFARAAEAGTLAVAEFRRAAELAPAEPELHFRLGLALLESEQYEPSLGPLKTATALAPDRASWQLPLAKALARCGDSRGAVGAIRAAVLGTPTVSDVKVARALMEQLTDPFGEVPSNARPRVEKALQWLEVGDVPQEAIVVLEELLQDYPDLAAVHALLGLAYARLDDTGRAVDELKSAIERAPADGKNHLYLAQLYLGRQKAKAAEEHLLRAVELNPVLDEAWARLGDLALDRLDYLSARQKFQVAKSLDPENLPVRGKLALVYQKEQNWPAGDQELRALLEKAPENVVYMLRLGVLHTEKYMASKSRADRDAAAQEASRWLKKVLELQPENALASRALEQVKAR